MQHAIESIDQCLDLAGAELLSRFGRDNHTRVKKDTSLVTDADLASEKIILTKIQNEFPTDAIICEESGYSGVDRRPGQKVWIIDPLDGTTNFANGYPFFSISIGYGVFKENGQIEVLAGGVGDPIHQKKYLAQAGLGASCNGAPIGVHADRPLQDSFLVTGFYYTKGQDLDREVERFRQVAQTCQSIRRDGSAALDLALVAAGVYDGFWERGLSIWDVAAGSLLVKEARGQVVNYPSQASSASLDSQQAKLHYTIEGDGIIAGTTTFVKHVWADLAHPGRSHDK